MKVYANTKDKTNFIQSLMHMIKGNLGTGILAMPATFNHCGLINGAIGLPLLCLVAGYCVHLLVRSSQHIENKLNTSHLEYAELAESSFEQGPTWIRPYSRAMSKLVDLVLVVCQLGICCVYLVFIVDNVISILATYNIHVHKNYLFLAILPIALLLSYIKTLRRLAIASACANLLQAVGLAIVVEYLIRDMPGDPKIEYFKPVSEVALGFGSAMFAFEGISVVLPIYTRMKRQEQMGRLCGLINVSFMCLLGLYTLIGVLGYLRFGANVADSITLNLPREPLYDMVRAIFAVSLFLSYPLQFYVLNEIVWGHLSSMLNSRESNNGKQQNHNVKYEYYCRTVLVLISFVLAVSVPKLNLMMDFFGSISGTALSVTLPPLIHLAAFWEDTSGPTKAMMLVVDLLIVAFGLVASANGSYFSLMVIFESFTHDNSHFGHANATTAAMEAMTYASSPSIGTH